MTSDEVLEKRGVQIAAVAFQLSQLLDHLAPSPEIAISGVATLLANTIALHARDDAAAVRMATTISATLPRVAAINRGLIRQSPGKPPNTVEVGHG